MVQIAPSILNANLANLESELQKIRNADWLHFDVMDGHFVPNLTFGPMFVAALKKVTTLPIEAHLMVDNPDVMVPLYAGAGSDLIMVHPESANAKHLHRLVQSIKEAGCKAGVALNPATGLEVLDYILPELDLVLLMTVNPGFGGQKLITSVIPKIQALRKIIDSRQLTCKIEVDGGVNWDNARGLVEAGTDILVAGTLIYHDPDPEAAVQRLKELVNKGR